MAQEELIHHRQLMNKDALAGLCRVWGSKDRGGHPGVARAVPWGVTAQRGPGLLPAWGWVGRPLPALRAL